MLGKLPPDSNDPEQEQLIRDTAGIAYQGKSPSISSNIDLLTSPTMIRGRRYGLLQPCCMHVRYSTYFGAQMSSSLPTFFLAMILHPAVVEKAQRELDAVVGTDRLPDFTDRPRLPYVNAIISEVLRWQPVTPLGTTTHYV